MLRQLMLAELQRLKEEQNGFKNPKWRDFYAFDTHLSEFYWEGIPTDNLFLEFYNEVMKWNHTGGFD